jgi:hypothetical protein
MKTQENETAIALTSSTDLPIGSIESLFVEYAEKLTGIKSISEYVDGKNDLIHYFTAGSSSNLMARELFDYTRAKSVLDSEFWSKAMQMTDVLEFMSASKRNEWSQMIHENKTPNFDKDNVITTIRNLLLSRTSFLAEKVDGIFKELSGEHVTNSPLAFKTKMIVSNVLSDDYLNYKKTEYLHDLRGVIAKILNREEPKSFNTRSDLGHIVRNQKFGEWHLFDGGAFKIKLFKKGTAHMEVNPSIAVKLNLILASLHPQAIATGARTVSKADKIQPLSQTILSYEVTDCLNEMIRNDGMEVVFSKYDKSKKLYAEVVEILEFLGGSENDGTWSFSYDVQDVLVKIVRTGCLPEKKSHQYYPTGKALAEKLVELAEITSKDSVLEPSAGQGGLAMFLPKDRTVCIEVNKINCLILTKKGFNAINYDFLLWNPKDKFSKIVMNPPFSNGSAEAHVRKASSLLKEGGKIVAILPASLRNKTIVEGMNHQWGEVIQNGFEDTGVNVVILELQK